MRGELIIEAMHTVCWSEGIAVRDGLEGDTPRAEIEKSAKSARLVNNHITTRKLIRVALF